MNANTESSPYTASVVVTPESGWTFEKILLAAKEKCYQEPSNLYINKLEIFRDGQVDCLSENEYGSSYKGEEYFIPVDIAEAICGEHDSVFLYKE